MSQGVARPTPTAEALLRAHGMRLTPQRRQVLGFFLSTVGHHWSADQVRAQLLGSMPELARGTIYKTLNELVRQHVLEEIATPEGVVLYGLRLEPHQHFYCEQCHTWFDVRMAGVEALRVVAGMERPAIYDVEVTVRGICDACRQANEERGGLNTRKESPPSPMGRETP
jgi:Fe2+ or Zn2+ uptake regulation protein